MPGYRRDRLSSIRHSRQFVSYATSTEKTTCQTHIILETGFQVYVNVIINVK